MSTIRCDLCSSEDTEIVYKPLGTRRDVDVRICNNCGLVFSDVKDIPYSRHPNISCDADWGNVRFCKGQRLDALKSEIPTNVNRVLDVGSSRGHFVRWMQSVNPTAEIWALEPDTRIADYPEDVLFLGQRLEDADLPRNYFDFIYCCQTLEHTDSATLILKKIYKLLAPSGILFVEVPNLGVISHPKNTEEFFIDKHNFHFTISTMRKYMEKCGFEIYNERPHDNLNVSVFAKKSGVFRYPKTEEREEVERIKSLIRDYSITIIENRDKIIPVVEKISRILDSSMKVAFWGANTLLDLMVKYGDLDPSRVKCLVDSYLWECADNVHGIKIDHPDKLRDFQPDVVIILARFSAYEIEQEARRYGVMKVIKFEALLG